MVGQEILLDFIYFCDLQHLALTVEFCATDILFNKEPWFSILFVNWCKSRRRQVMGLDLIYIVDLEQVTDEILSVLILLCSAVIST